MSFLELILYTMCHVQEHAAQLNLFLGQNASDEASDWVSRLLAHSILTPSEGCQRLPPTDQRQELPFPSPDRHNTPDGTTYLCLSKECLLPKCGLDLTDVG